MSKNCVSRSAIPLLSHQTEVVKFLYKNRGLIAVHTTGSGKTLTAVTASQCFLDAHPNSHVIVLAPKSLITNFQKELVRYDATLNPKGSRYKFYSYERFAMDESLHGLCNENNMLILDEAHQMRGEVDSVKVDEKSSRRSQVVIRCAKKVKRVLVLTATPFVNDSYDLANLLAIVKGTNPLPREQWDQMMQNPKNAESYFKDCFHYYAVEKTRANKYPAVSIHETYIEMDWKFYEQYRKIEQKSDLKLLGDFGQKPSSFWIGFRRALLELPESSKINFTMNQIKATLTCPKDKIVIYTNFVQAGVRLLESHLKRENINYAVIKGDMSINARQASVNDYNSGKIRVLILSAAGGTGIDLKETTRMIIMDVPWNKAQLEQIIGRAARYQSHTNLPVKDQKVDVFVLYNTKPASIWYDATLAKCAQEKKKATKLPVPSVDLILKKIIEDKTALNNQLVDLIRKVSAKTFNKAPPTKRKVHAELIESPKTAVDMTTPAVVMATAIPSQGIVQRIGNRLQPLMARLVNPVMARVVGARKSKSRSRSRSRSRARAY